jgi:hypothetical protein
MSTEFLVIHTSTETVVIGRRSARGGGNGLCRLASEDEVRRRLIQAASSDPASLERLRRFWAVWQSEPIRIDVMPDRMLIERVITATQFGPLSMYVMPDGSVKHVFGGPGGKAAPALTGTVSTVGAGGRPLGGAASGGSGPKTTAASAATIPGTVLQTAAGTQTLGAGSGEDPFVWIDRSRLEDRLKLVIERALNVLMMDPRTDFTPLLKQGVIAESAEVMATWGRAYHHGLGLIIDALVVASSQIPENWALMEAANRLSEVIEKARAAHSLRDIDEAARRMAWALAMIGAPAFITAIRRGVDRVQASLARKPRRGPPPPVRRVERGLVARPNSAQKSNGLRQSKLPRTAAKSEKRPELEKIAKDPTVEAEIDKSWNASNPNGPGKKQEHGFWVLKDDKTGALSVQQFPQNTATNDSMIPGPTPAEPGKTTVAFFHTPPNTSNEGYVSEPSDADEKFAKARGVPGIIRSHDGMYYFGPK